MVRGWREVLIFIVLFLLGAGTFLPVFMIFMLAGADKPLDQPVELEMPKAIEQPHVEPNQGPFAATTYRLELNKI